MKMKPSNLLRKMKQRISKISAMRYEYRYIVDGIESKAQYFATLSEIDKIVKVIKNKIKPHKLVEVTMPKAQEGVCADAEALFGKESISIYLNEGKGDCRRK